MQTFPSVDLCALADYVQRYSEQYDIDALLANFHLLYFLAVNNASAPPDAQMSDVRHIFLVSHTLHVFYAQEQLLSLCTAVSRSLEDGGAAVREWARQCQPYSALLMHAHNSAQQAAGATAGGSNGPAHGEQWQCASCTFLNPNSNTDCEMCNLPRHR